MKLAQIINEKLTSFVYVKQTIGEFTKLLKSNQIKLEPHLKANKSYYVLKTSKSRSALVDKQKALVVLQLNGERLNAEIKAKNVSFYLNDKNTPDGDNLYSDEPVVKNAMQFVEQASILVHGKEIIPVRELKEIEALCSQNNIPLYFFNNREDFSKNTRNKAQTLGKPDYNYKRQQYKLIPDSVKALIYLSKAKDIASLPPQYAKMLGNVTVDNKTPTFFKKVKQDLASIKHNELADTVLAALYKQAGTENLEKIISDLVAKWKGLLAQRK